jgi:hypothetical protein
VPELKKVLGLMLAMGIVNNPILELYCIKDPVFEKCPTSILRVFYNFFTSVTATCMIPVWTDYTK